MLRTAGDKGAMVRDNLNCPNCSVLRLWNIDDICGAVDVNPCPQGLVPNKFPKDPPMSRPLCYREGSTPAATSQMSKDPAWGHHWVSATGVCPKGDMG